MSKYYEEYTRLNVSDLELFDRDPKGELTLVLSEKNNQKIISNNLTESDKKNIKKMIKILSIKDIINLVGQNNKVSKKKIYNYCLKLKNEK